MSEFAQFAGDFFSDRNKWNEPRRRALLSDLVGIAQRHVYQKFGSAVINNTFDETSDEVMRKFRLTAYVLAARTCAADVRRWTLVTKIPQAPIAYIFESGDTGKDGPVKGKLIERMERDGFPTPIFLAKKDVVRDGVTYPGFTALQAADILAYEYYLVVKRRTIERWAFEEFDKYPPGVLGLSSGLTGLDRKRAVVRC